MHHILEINQLTTPEIKMMPLEQSRELFNECFTDNHIFRSINEVLNELKHELTTYFPNIEQVLYNPVIESNDSVHQSNLSITRAIYIKISGQNILYNIGSLDFNTYDINLISVTWQTVYDSKVHNLTVIS